jgi:copper(I)-binding protein
MKRTILLAASLFLVLAQGALGQGAKPSIAVTDAWARAMPPGAKTGAAYVTLANKGSADDKLVSVSTPVAAEAQLHTTINDNGVMKMRPVSAIDVKPGATVTLKPGGLHLMLMGVKQPLTEGQSFPMTLTFAKAGKVETTVAVKKVGAMGTMEMHGSGEMKGMSNMNMEGMPKK